MTNRGTVIKNDQTDIVVIPEAPIDDLTYGRKNASWVTISGGGGTGDGDMLKSVYDTDNDGIIDFAKVSQGILQASGVSPVMLNIDRQIYDSGFPGIYALIDANTNALLPPESEANTAKFIYNYIDDYILNVYDDSETILKSKIYPHKAALFVSDGISWSVLSNTHDELGGLDVISNYNHVPNYTTYSGMYLTTDGTQLMWDQHTVVYNEDITGTGTSFTTASEFAPNSLRVYLNGVKQKKSEFTEGENHTSFTTQFTVAATDNLSVDYNNPVGIVQGGSTTTEGVDILQMQVFL